MEREEGNAKKSYSPTLTNTPPAWQDSVAALAMRTGRRPSIATDSSLGIVVDCINEGDNLVDECLVVTLEEEPQRLLGVSAVLGQYGGGVQQVVGIGSHALRTERLYALVVAVNCLTGSC